MTGNFEALQTLIDRLRSLRTLNQTNKAKQLDDYTTNIWLIDPKGCLMQRYSGNPLDVPRETKELVQLDSCIHYRSYF